MIWPCFVHLMSWYALVNHATLQNVILSIYQNIVSKLLLVWRKQNKGRHFVKDNTDPHVRKSNLRQNLILHTVTDILTEPFPQQKTRNSSTWDPFPSLLLRLMMTFLLDSILAEKKLKHQRFLGEKQQQQRYQQREKNTTNYCCCCYACWTSK